MGTRQSRRRGRRLFVILGVIASLWLVALVWPVSRATPPSLWVGADAPLVIAHQGGNQEAPGNTMAAFDRAVAVGADALEFDVALTADGELVIIHDLTVDRTTDGSGAVSELTISELARLDAAFGLEDESGRPIRDPALNPFIGQGIGVPALRDLFARHPQMPMLIEIKNDGELGSSAAAELASLIDEYNRADRTIVASFHEDSLVAFRDASGGSVVTSASQGEMIPYYAFFRLGWRPFNNRPPFAALQLPTTFDVGPITLDLTTASFRRYTTRRGLPIHYWTINDDAEMVRLAQLGAAGLITDRPEAMRGIFANN